MKYKAMILALAATVSMTGCSTLKQASNECESIFGSKVLAYNLQCAAEENDEAKGESEKAVKIDDGFVERTSGNVSAGQEELVAPGLSENPGDNLEKKIYTDPLDIVYDIHTEEIQKGDESKVFIKCTDGKNKLWEYESQLHPICQFDILSDVYVDDNEAYFMEAGRLIAFDKISGTQKWTSETPATNVASTDDNNIYLDGGESLGVYRISKSGDSLSERLLIDEYGYVNEIILNSNKLYVDCWAGDRQGLIEYDSFTFNPTGTEILYEEEKINDAELICNVSYCTNGNVSWQYRTQSISDDYSHLDFKLYADESSVYVFEKNKVVAIDKSTGNQRWSAGGLTNTFSHEIDSKNFYYTKNGTVYAIDKITGVQLWAKEFSKSEIVITSDSKNLYAYDNDSDNLMIISKEGKVLCLSKNSVQYEVHSMRVIGKTLYVNSSKALNQSATRGLDISKFV